MGLPIGAFAGLRDIPWLRFQLGACLSGRRSIVSGHVVGQSLAAARSRRVLSAKHDPWVCIPLQSHAVAEFRRAGGDGDLHVRITVAEHVVAAWFQRQTFYDTCLWSAALWMCGKRTSRGAGAFGNTSFGHLSAVL